MIVFLLSIPTLNPYCISHFFAGNLFLHFSSVLLDSQNISIYYRLYTYCGCTCSCKISTTLFQVLSDPSKSLSSSIPPQGYSPGESNVMEENGEPGKRKVYKKISTSQDKKICSSVH